MNTQQLQSLQRRRRRQQPRSRRSHIVFAILFLTIFVFKTSSPFLLSSKSCKQEQHHRQQQQQEQQPTTTSLPREYTNHQYQQDQQEENTMLASHPLFSSWSLKSLSWTLLDSSSQQTTSKDRLFSYSIRTAIGALVMSIIIFISPITVPRATSAISRAWAAEMETEILETRPLITESTIPSKIVLSDMRSMVFDSMDEEPEIEQEIAEGSTTKVIKLHEVPLHQCYISTEKGDVLEIDYVAKRLYRPVTVYDASIFRGTGQPFKFVLGSGVMIPGVDQGLYNMCPGEVRKLKIPPKLAVGLLDPPAKAPLEWQIELISIDGIVRKDNNDGEIIPLTRDQYAE